MFFVIQIGNQFYSTFRGKDLDVGTIETGILYKAKRFFTETSAKTSADLIRANESIKHDVLVRKCGLID